MLVLFLTAAIFFLWVFSTIRWVRHCNKLSQSVTELQNYSVDLEQVIMTYEVIRKNSQEHFGSQYTPTRFTCCSCREFFFVRGDSVEFYPRSCPYCQGLFNNVSIEIDFNFKTGEKTPRKNESDDG